VPVQAEGITIFGESTAILRTGESVYKKDL
jgi:hypothetical protein